MGNRFKCSLAHGGSGGAEGNTLIVTCDSAFAGHTISASKSGTTYTQTCPSSSPYTVTFHGLEAGTWTISAIVSGDTYSKAVTITDSTALLSYGFNWATWVTLGGLDPTDYSDLSDVFADEAAVRRLMLVHASADYLIDAVTGNVDVIDDFCADDTAMKWIGLCDYVCDGLTAIAGVETKFLASTYWERYLKDHVPTMTGNTAPYGTASATNNSTVAYKAFNGTNESGTSDAYEGSGLNIRLEYEFPTPICVKKILVANRNYSTVYAIENFKLQGSNDGVTWTDIGSFTKADGVANEETFSAASNTTYFKKLGIYITSTYDTSSTHYSRVGKLQFYGRSLNVSVPVMTNNTLPYGEAFADASEDASHYAYKAFDDVISASNYWGASGIEHQIGYKFDSKVCIKMVSIIPLQENGYDKAKNCILKGSDDGTTYNRIDNFDTVFKANNNLDKQWFAIDSNSAYRHIILDVTSEYSSVWIHELQFYGVDYSEKEFETGSTKKWIYDHGVVLEPISEAITTGGSITFNDDYIEINRNNASANCSVATDSTVDLTGYSYLYAIVGIASGSALWHLIATSNRTAGTSSATAKADVNTASDDTKGGLDISSLNQALYLAVYAGNIAVQDLKELWAA